MPSLRAGIMDQLPNDVVAHMRTFLCSRDSLILLCSIDYHFHEQSSSPDGIMIGDIIRYYTDHIYDDDVTLFLCDYVDWVMNHDGTAPIRVSNITSTNYRNVERHFTEIWKQYGGTLSFHQKQIVVPPPSRRIFSNTFLNWFISRWNNDDIEVINYGYADYFCRDYY